MTTCPATLTLIQTVESQFIRVYLATGHVFIVKNTISRPLQQPYDEPYKILSRMNKAFFLDIYRNKQMTSVDRLKPAFLLNDEFQPDLLVPVPATSYQIVLNTRHRLVELLNF
ncbi:hypothetical protein TNCT_677401 [Trichonephila clavata]|uniref:Uncharacterized protein n=1 Tax=Trichonephila clavata TaxID=2740835 RepID=A0A8X6GJZ0_TRICU|nr:hypothetical protein TNCT_677401 [Trichonephila clavata]